MSLQNYTIEELSAEISRRYRMVEEARRADIEQMYKESDDTPIYICNNCGRRQTPRECRAYESLHVYCCSCESANMGSISIVEERTRRRQLGVLLSQLSGIGGILVHQITQKEEGMKVIAIAMYGEDFPVAVVKLQEKLDPEFAKELRNLRSWTSLNDHEALVAQTFVAWFRKLGFNQPSLQQCLENDQYAWSDAMEVQEV